MTALEVLLEEVLVAHLVKVPVEQQQLAIIDTASLSSPAIRAGEMVGARSVTWRANKHAQEDIH